MPFAPPTCMRMMLGILLLMATFTGGCARQAIWAEPHGTMPQQNAMVFDSPEMRWAQPLREAEGEPWYAGRNDAMLAVEAGRVGPVIEHSHRYSTDRRAVTGSRVRDYSSETTSRHRVIYLVR